MKFKAIIIALSLLAGAFAANAEGYQSIRVNLGTGKTMNFNLSDDLNITFDDTYMIVKSSDVSLRIMRNLIETFDFLDTTGAINDPAAENVAINGGILDLSALSGDSYARVYSVSGQLLAVWNGTPIDLRNLGQSTLVVDLNGTIVKIAL